jgi:hypothetical protein
MKVTNKENEIGIKMKRNIFVFIENMWGLTPQPVKPEFEAFVKLCIDMGEYDKVTKEHFQKFVKYKHITWQQFLTLSAYQRAIDKKDKKEISVVSGHGVGKSATIAWIIFHFLFAHANSNIACTAPSKEQMFGVLWKEASLWQTRMKLEKIKSWFKITSDKIVVKGRARHWWANAKTASKDKPEALSGVHADDVLLLVDEASGVDDIVYENAMGSLTNENYVFIMISNGTKDKGLFFRSHNSEDEKDMYQHLQFSSEDSPVVDPTYCKKTLKKAGGDRDDDLYRVRVRGLFPKTGSLDDKNWYSLIKQSYLNIVSPEEFYEWDINQTVMGIDPSGRGQDETVWVLRDNFRTRIIGWEKISNPTSIARKTWAFLEFFNLVGCPICIDNFGVGANVGLKIRDLTNIPNFGQFIYGINVGDKLTHPILSKRFYDLRAYYYDTLNAWLMNGGEVVKDKRFINELPALMYTYADNQIIRMMGKKILKSLGIASPNCWDAVMLTFKVFNTKLLDEKSMTERHKTKINSLSNTTKKSKINNEDYLNDYL